MPYADIGDVKLYYEIYGSEYELLPKGVRKKPTIVAIHGGPGIDHNYYDTPFFKDAGKFAQVVLIDQRGNGLSIDTNSAHWNLRQWAEDVYQFCNTLGLEKPFIHGVSMGGWVAMLYASLYSHQAGGLLLTDTEAYLDIDAITQAFEVKGGQEVKTIVENYFYRSSPEIMQDYFLKCIPLCSNNPVPDAWLERTIMTPEVNAYFKEKELMNFNLMEDLKKITLPVLYLTNTTNPLHLYSSAKKAADAMINAKVEFIPFENCGLVAMDAKEKALQEIQAFLDKHHI